MWWLEWGLGSGSMNQSQPAQYPCVAFRLLRVMADEQPHDTGAPVLR